MTESKVYSLRRIPRLMAYCAEQGEDGETWMIGDVFLSSPSNGALKISKMLDEECIVKVSYTDEVTGFIETARVVAAEMDDKDSNLLLLRLWLTECQLRTLAMASGIDHW